MCQNTKSPKLPLTYEQQVSRLEERGLIISDKQFAIDVLSRLSYYAFTGYLYDFKTNSNDYLYNLTFDRVYYIYEFDKRFRNLMLYVIETIEHTLKTQIAYNIAHEKGKLGGALGYLDKQNFKDEKEHDIFISHLNRAIENNRHIPFVKHHIKKYNREFPIWVAMELCTMGMVFNLYNNLPTSTQRSIARQFNTGVNQLGSWIENIRYVRNLFAHYMRTYNFKLQKIPKQCNRNGLNPRTTYKIFDILYIMKFLYLDSKDWNNNVLNNLRALIDQYSEFIELDAIGFPEDWENILYKSI